PQQLSLDTLNPLICKAKYAVRGAVVAAAAEVEKSIQRGERSFKEIVYCASPRVFFFFFVLLLLLMLTRQYWQPSTAGPGAHHLVPASAGPGGVGQAARGAGRQGVPRGRGCGGARVSAGGEERGSVLALAGRRAGAARGRGFHRTSGWVSRRSGAHLSDGRR